MRSVGAILVALLWCPTTAFVSNIHVHVGRPLLAKKAGASAFDNSTATMLPPRTRAPKQDVPALVDGPYGVLMVTAFRLAMAIEADGWQSPQPFWPSISFHFPWTSPPSRFPRVGVSTEESYAGLVEVARRFFTAPAVPSSSSVPSKGTSSSDRVKGVLRAFPSGGRYFQLLHNNKISMELLGLLTPLLMRFLVGECSTETWLKKNEEEGREEPWRSKVVIEQCRFLEASKCKGMCVGLCLLPTQSYFTEELGLPLTMQPNFETGGCEMTWGLAPQEVPTEGTTAYDAATDLRCFVDCALASRAISEHSALRAHDADAVASVPNLAGAIWTEQTQNSRQREAEWRAPAAAPPPPGHAPKRNLSTAASSPGPEVAPLVEGPCSYVPPDGS